MSYFLLIPIFDFVAFDEQIEAQPFVLVLGCIRSFAPSSLHDSRLRHALFVAFIFLYLADNFSAPPLPLRLQSYAPTATPNPGDAIVMIFGAQARSNKATLLLAGSVIFLFIFVGLVYNHLDYWHTPASYVESHHSRVLSRRRLVARPKLNQDTG